MPNEFIICAAVWFPVPDICAHQPKNIEHGLVICGRRHHNCFSMRSLLEDDLQSKTRRVVPEQGFLTNTNRFVRRFEAARIAAAANQIKGEMCIKDELCSEDLW